jgi:hypothetical protein
VPLAADPGFPVRCTGHGSVCGPGWPHGTPGQAGPHDFLNANEIRRKSGPGPAVVRDRLATLAVHTVFIVWGMNQEGKL